MSMKYPIWSINIKTSSNQTVSDWIEVSGEYLALQNQTAWQLRDCKWALAVHVGFTVQQ